MGYHLEHLALGGRVEAVAAFYLHGGDAGLGHAADKEIEAVQKFVGRRLACGVDGALYAAAGVHDIHIRPSFEAHTELIGAKPSEHGVGVTVDKPREQYTPSQVNSLALALRVIACSYVVNYSIVADHHHAVFNCDKILHVGTLNGFLAFGRYYLGIEKSFHTYCTNIRVICEICD